MRKTITKSAYKTSVIKTIKLLFFLSIILLCILLGLWQIDRGIQKKQLYEEFKETLSKKPVLMKTLPENPKLFTNMHINGEFLVNRQFLLDNKIHNKIAGYEVITPFKVNDKIILVNRGWVNSNNRQSIPEILIQNKITSIYGYSYYYKKLYELDEDNYVNKWPLIIQNIEIDKVSQLLGYDIEPYVIIMNKKHDDSYALRTIFKENMQLKHYMYAGQWFLFATIGLIFMIILLRKEKNNEQKSN